MLLLQKNFIGQHVFLFFCNNNKALPLSWINYLWTIFSTMITRLSLAEHHWENITGYHNILSDIFSEVSYIDKSNSSKNIQWIITLMTDFYWWWYLNDSSHPCHVKKIHFVETAYSDEIAQISCIINNVIIVPFIIPPTATLLILITRHSGLIGSTLW